MKTEMKILSDRIERFGEMWMTDEHGSYIDGEIEKLLLALTDDEVRELCNMEKSRKAVSVA